MNLLRHWMTMGRAYWSYLRGSEPTYSPFRIWVEPSSICQLKCVMCPNKDLPREMLGHMNMATFRSVIDECASFAYDVNLTHRGEPLLNPDIVDMVGYGAAAGPKMRMHTNAMALTRDLSGALIDSGLELMSFSVDGFTRETYESIRIGASWDRVLENTTVFLEEKARRGTKRPYAIIQVIDVPGFDTTEIERKAFMKRFRGLPVDEIYVKQASNWAGDFHADLYDGESYSPCTFPWYALTVCFDGTIVPCPQDFFCRLKLGHVEEGGIEVAWRSDVMKNLRKAMRERRFDTLDPCHQCDRIRRPRSLGLPATNLSVFLVENLLGYTKWKSRLFADKDGAVKTK